MTKQFHAQSDFSSDLCSEVASLEPLNPFRSWAYAQAMTSLGKEPWLFYAQEQGRIVTGCFGFLRSGRINRSLEIPSIPAIPEQDEFWGNLAHFCSERRVSRLSIQSFASAGADIPSMTGEIERRQRNEYFIDLQAPVVWSGASTNHRRNIQKGQKAGLVVECTRDVGACAVHAHLQNASMERRAVRGEEVVADAHVRNFKALLQNGAGEIFRAKKGDNVLSSILVLRAARGAYYHSAGTNSEGMAVGASHFLISQIAEALRGEGMERFNLGAAGDNNLGLERFKSGFGAKSVKLECAEFDLASPLHRGVSTIVDLLRKFMRHGLISKQKPSARTHNTSTS